MDNGLWRRNHSVKSTPEQKAWGYWSRSLFMVMTFMNFIVFLSIKYKLFRICPQVKTRNYCLCRFWAANLFHWLFLPSLKFILQYSEDEFLLCILGLTITLRMLGPRRWQCFHCHCNNNNLKRTIVLIMMFNHPQICTWGTLDVVIVLKSFNYEFKFICTMIQYEIFYYLFI